MFSGRASRRTFSVNTGMPRSTANRCPCSHSKVSTCGCSAEPSRGHARTSNSLELFRVLIRAFPPQSTRASLFVPEHPTSRGVFPQHSSSQYSNAASWGSLPRPHLHSYWLVREHHLELRLEQLTESLFHIAARSWS